MLSMLQGNILHHFRTFLLHFLRQQLEIPVIKQYVYIGTV